MRRGQTLVADVEQDSGLVGPGVLSNAPLRLLRQSATRGEGLV